MAIKNALRIWRFAGLSSGPGVWSHTRFPSAGTTDLDFKNAAGYTSKSTFFRDDYAIEVVHRSPSRKKDIVAILQNTELNPDAKILYSDRGKLYRCEHQKIETEHFNEEAIQTAVVDAIKAVNLQNQKCLFVLQGAKSKIYNIRTGIWSSVVIRQQESSQDPLDITAQFVSMCGNVSVGVTQVADTIADGISFTGTPLSSTANTTGTVAGAAGGVIGAGIGAYNLYKAYREKEPEPNELLLSFPGASSSSLNTRQFLMDRQIKNMAGATASGAGGVLSGFTQVNTLGLVKNISSLATTSAHIHKLKGIRDKIPKADNLMVRNLLKKVLQEKGVKAAARSGAVLADGIPAGIPAAGAAVGTASAMITAFLKMTSAQRCLVMSKLLHFHAYQHVRKYPQWNTARQGANENPEGYWSAMIVRELLTQRGISAVFDKTKNAGIKKWGKKGSSLGRAKTAEYMKEPGGWMVIHDKLAAL